MTWDNFKEMSNIDKSLENMHYLMNKSRKMEIETFYEFIFKLSDRTN